VIAPGGDSHPPAVDVGPTTTTIRGLFPGNAHARVPATGAAKMRDLIKLTCQDCKRDNYVTDKNKRTQTEKFEIKKFCRACRRHTSHKEGKISKG
jgi:large subunit ribosomal protein L33